MTEAFHREHELVYEHCDRDAAVQIVNLRLVIVGMSPKPIFPERNLTVQPATPERSVEVFTGGRLTSVSLFHREQLAPRVYLRWTGHCCTKRLYLLCSRRTVR